MCRGDSASSSDRSDGSSSSAFARVEAMPLRSRTSCGCTRRISSTTKSSCASNRPTCRRRVWAGVRIEWVARPGLVGRKKRSSRKSSPTLRPAHDRFRFERIAIDSLANKDVSIMSQTMIAANQSRFAFKSAGLAADAVQVSEFTGVEEVSHTFRFVVQLTSTDGELDLDAVIGQPATLALMRQDGEMSPIHGIVQDFQQKAFTTGNYYYEATLVPRLWLLSLNHQCRVFQNLKVDEIVTEVLKQAGFGARDFRFVLRAALPTREYCVQYRETDLAFVQRLLEHEGIYYFFEQPSSGGEVVVFTDDRG